MSARTLARPGPPRLLGWLAVAFGAATLIEGGQVLFGGPAARAQAGNVVSFVLVFNFGAGFAYVAGGLLTLLGRGESIRVARGIAAATLLVFGALGVHVAAGGAHETRTLAAMTLRSAFWVAQALLLPRWLAGGRRERPPSTRRNA